MLPARFATAMLASILALTATAPVARADARRLVSFGTEWRYQDKGEDLGTEWRSPEFTYAAWPVGKSPLAYGEIGAATKLSFGEDPKNKPITTYFRKYFILDQIPKDNELTLNIKYADGFALYLNGKLLKAANLPDKFDSKTPALKPHDFAVPEIFEAMPTTLLREGKNYLAVEVHLHSPASQKLGLNMELKISPISDRLRIKPAVDAPAIKEWLVSDVFPNDDQSTRLKRDYLNGEAAALPDPSSKLGAKVWRAYSSPDGCMDFTDERFKLSRKTNIAIYAHTYVYSPIEQGALLIMGSDDGCAAWLNGHRVHFNDIYRGFVADKDEAPVHLLAGWNRLLVKVSQGGGSWKLQAKLAHIDGKGIKGLNYSIKNPLSPQEWAARRSTATMDIMRGKTMAYVNNGRLALWIGQSQDSMVNILVDGKRAGSLRAAVAQFEKRGVGYRKTGVGWCEANKVKDIKIDSTDPKVCAADVTVERTDSKETQRKFEATYRFTIRLNQPWFESRLLRLKNTDTVEYLVCGYWHKLQPPFSDAEPHCCQWIAAWASDAGGVGAFVQDEDAVVLALRSHDGRPYGDITRTLGRRIAPGFGISLDEPAVIIFVTEKRQPDGILKEGALIRLRRYGWGDVQAAPTPQGQGS
ncbi:MAG: hypothetical protein GXP25_24155 [Planctomycetes bacterium]|nr:hypothetical protein [Planctomycetota bacterium]